VDTLSAAVMLFLIMDPVGNVPVFLAVLKQVPEERRRRVLIRELLLSLAVMLAFFFLGEYALRLLQLKPEAVSVGGGIVLFLISLRMIFPPEHGSLMGDMPEGEPFLVPLAIPFVAGPSVLAAMLFLTRTNPGQETSWLLVAVLISWAATAVILYFSTYLYKLLKDRGLIAMERLMGMILVMMSVQMFLDGVKAFLGPPKG
jgi:multiple antibiotic resistance protein